jgi:hypothetical protein
MNVWGMTKKILGISMLVLPLTMTATLTGCLTEDEDDDSTGGTETAWPSEITLNLGGQAHPTLGSVAELDTGKVYTSAVANANVSAIDLVFLYYTGGWHIDNSKSAKAAGIANSINLTNSYPDAAVRDNKFVKVTTKPANQEAGKAAFNAGTELSSSAIANGDMFLVETTGGKLVLVTVTSLTGVATGAADIKVSIGSLSP